MSMIKVENLTFAYPGSYDNIFENVDFVIDTDWKLGFIGRNGRGKTTFLNLLLGSHEYSGKIISSVQFDYFPYHVDDKSRLTSEILYEVCPEAEEWELMRELSYLRVDEGVLYRTFDTLSGGEQTKLLLAALFLNKEHFLLIDEPTNHLDTEARIVLAQYLRKKKGFILVSHDRRFLDGCVDHILSLNRTNIEVQSGNFSSWFENFENRQESERLRSEHLKKDIRRLKESARRTSAWSDKVESSKNGAYDKGFIGHKAAKMMKRSKAIEARQTEAIEEKSALLRDAEEAEQLKIHSLDYHSDTLIRVKNVSAVYDGVRVSEPVSFEIKKGSRTVLDGLNGCGKSSLLKIIAGEKIDYSGEISVGSGVVISYVSQDTSNLSGSLSDYAEKHSLDESLFKSILRKMDFERIQFEKDMSDFSGGQKKKVLIARSLCEKAHIFIWDEPLNFIDLYSRIQIEELIKEYNPTIIFVEHDIAFRENTATDIVHIEKNSRK